MRGLIALGACVLLFGCDEGGGGGGGGASGTGAPGSGAPGSGTGGGGSAGEGGGAGGGGRVIVANDSSVSLIDTGDGTELASLPYDFFAEELHLAGDAIVLGGSEGELLVADAETLDLRGQLALGSDVQAITSIGSEAFVAVLGDGTSDAGPALVRVDLTSVAETSRFAHIEVNEQTDAMLAAGDDVIALVGNGFGLVRVSKASQTVTQSKRLGQNPDDPEGPRGEFYGYGMLASAGGRYWVFDEYNDRLLGVDAASFEVQVMHDVATVLEDGGATHLVSDGSELFLSLADKDQIVVFDGSTGEVDRTLDVADGARAIGVRDGRIYVDADETIGDLLVLDAQTGAELARVLAVFADFVAPL